METSEQILLYSNFQLVAEIGGILGLFVGVSFLDISNMLLFLNNVLKWSCKTKFSRFLEYLGNQWITWLRIMHWKIFNCIFLILNGYLLVLLIGKSLVIIFLPIVFWQNFISLKYYFRYSFKLMHEIFLMLLSSAIQFWVRFMMEKLNHHKLQSVIFLSMDFI